MAKSKPPSSTSSLLLRDGKNGKGHRLSEGQGTAARSGQRGPEMEAWESRVWRRLVLQELGALEDAEQARSWTLCGIGGLEGDQSGKKSWWRRATRYWPRLAQCL